MSHKFCKSQLFCSDCFAVGQTTTECTNFTHSESPRIVTRLTNYPQLRVGGGVREQATRTIRNVVAPPDETNRVLPYLAVHGWAGPSPVANRGFQPREYADSFLSSPFLYLLPLFPFPIPSHPGVFSFLPFPSFPYTLNPARVSEGARA